jgi:hypothetical protein
MKPLVVFLCSVLLLVLISQPSFSQTAIQPSGSGTAGDPYQVSSLANLYWITQNDTAWGSYYEQTADINAASTSTWDSNAGFLAIGNGTTQFTGTYNGGNHTIDSLYIDRPSDDYVGFIGYATGSSGGSIKNLGITNVRIISGGYQDGGALAGRVGGGGIIDNCYSTGAVAGDFLGGLVGVFESGTLSNSYSTCTVAGAYGSGGLIETLLSGTVTDCYSSGSVSTAVYEYGGLIGYYSAGTVSNCFWDTQTSNQTSSAAGTGKNTSEMKTLSTFTGAGWDFEIETANGTNSYWDMDTTNKVYNNGYPFLSWQNGSAIALPVQMVSFAAKAEQLSAELTWTTATEVDNRGWEVERRETSNARWSTIGFVAGSGTSTRPMQYAYVDQGLAPGLYSYRLKQVDRTGVSKYSGETQVLVGSAPREFSLSQNYPNPFNPTTTIEFTIPADGRAVLRVYDITGREVVTLLDKEVEAGTYQRAVFDGSRYASGVYVARLQYGGKQLSKEMVLLK